MLDESEAGLRRAASLRRKGSDGSTGSGKPARDMTQELSKKYQALSVDEGQRHHQHKGQADAGGTAAAFPTYLAKCIMPD